jgi:RHH-type rel operon transcriptional repressor/antitoxin RelB
MSAVLTVRVSDDLKSSLDRLSKATGRSRSFLAFEAIQQYVDLESWQIEEIHQGIQEADAGLFASDSEVKRVMNKWK